MNQEAIEYYEGSVRAISFVVQDWVDEGIGKEIIMENSKIEDTSKKSEENDVKNKSLCDHCGFRVSEWLRENFNSLSISLEPVILLLENAYTEIFSESSVKIWEKSQRFLCHSVCVEKHTLYYFELQ